MSTTSNRETLDELFAAWSDDQASASPRPLSAWIGQNPEQAGDFAQWAVDAPISTWAETQPVNATLETRTLEIGRDVLAQFRVRLASSPTPVVIADLYQAAARQALKPKELAVRLGVGLPLVAKLQNRLIQAVSLPNTLVEQIAELLATSAESVRAYFQQPATLPAGAMYKADAAPQVQAQESFADAIKACAAMSDEQKRFWLEAE